MVSATSRLEEVVDMSAAGYEGDIDKGVSTRTEHKEPNISLIKKLSLYSTLYIRI